MKIDKSIYSKSTKIKKFYDGTQRLQSSYVLDSNNSDVDNNAEKNRLNTLDQNSQKNDQIRTGLSAAAAGVSAVNPIIGAAMYAGIATDSIGRKIPGSTDKFGNASDSWTGTFGKMASPVEGIKNLTTGNKADAASGVSTFLGGGVKPLLMKLTGTKVDPIFGKSSAQLQQDKYDADLKRQGELQQFMNSKVTDNYSMYKKNRVDRQTTNWGQQNNSNSPLLAKTGMKGYKCANGSSSIKPKAFGVIEIEGKNGVGEIHTDETMRQVKTIGIMPHYAGGTKAIAKEGDVVFNTQGKPEKYARIMGAIEKGDQKTLEKERKKIPGDSGETAKGGIKKYKTGEVHNTPKGQTYIDNSGDEYNLAKGQRYVQKKGSNTWTQVSGKFHPDVEKKFYPSGADNSGAPLRRMGKPTISYGGKDEKGNEVSKSTSDDWSIPQKQFALAKNKGESNRIGYKVDNQKIKDLVGAGAEVVPILHNLLQKPVMPNERGKLYSRMNQFISTKPLEDAVTADTYAANKHNAVEMSGGNASNARANTIAANETARMQRAGTVANDNQRYSEVQNANNALRNQDAKFNYEQDFLNQREKYQVRSQKQEQITKAMSQIGELGARGRERVAQQNYNKEYLDAVKEGYSTDKLNESLGAKTGVKSLKFGYKKK